MDFGYEYELNKKRNEELKAPAVQQKKYYTSIYLIKGLE
jgi:hypothetical protein